MWVYLIHEISQNQHRGIFLFYGFPNWTKNKKSDYVLNLKFQLTKGASRTIHDRAQDGKGYWWVLWNFSFSDCVKVFRFWRNAKINELRIDDSIKVLMAWSVDTRWISMRLKSNNKTNFNLKAPIMRWWNFSKLIHDNSFNE